MRIERLPRRTLVPSVSSIAAVSTVCKSTPVTRHEDESDGRNDSRTRHRPRSGSGRGRGGQDGRRAGVRSATVPASADRNVPGERGHAHPVPCGMDHPAHRRQNRLHGIPDPAPELSPGPGHSPPFCCWHSQRPYAPRTRWTGTAIRCRRTRSPGWALWPRRLWGIGRCRKHWPFQIRRNHTV